MLKFNRIDLKDKDIINNYLLSYHFLSCDYYFNTLFLWQEYYNYEICIYENILFIKCSNYGTELFYPPLGDLKKGIILLKEYCDYHKHPLIFTLVEDTMKNEIERLYPNQYYFVLNEDNMDYIYKASDLALLEGKKYKAKRNQINSFKSKYEYSFELIDINNQDKYLAFLEAWHKKHKEDNVAFDAEEKAIIKSIKYMDSLDMVGGVLYVSGSIVAITIGSIQNRMIDVHFEKADIDYQGSYQVVNQLFISSLLDKIDYVNREEDLGIPGLRKAKESYNPVLRATNYNAYHKDDYKYEIIVPGDLSSSIDLWKKTFNDGNYANWFYDNVKSVTYNGVLNNSIVALANVLYFDKVAYLYALATKPMFRRHGIMRHLLQYIEKININQGIYMSMLIPSGEGVYDFYLGLGYELVTRCYKYVYTLALANVSYKTGFDYEIINSIYEKNMNGIYHLLRTKDNWKNIIDEIALNNGFIIYNDNSYAIVSNNEVREFFGDNSLLNEVLLKLNKKEITVYNNQQGEPVKAFIKKYKSVSEETYYFNLLFD